MAKHIIVRAFDGEIEHFRGDNVRASVRDGGVLYVYEEDAPEDENLGIFNRWEYVRKKESQS